MAISEKSSRYQLLRLGMTKSTQTLSVQEVRHWHGMVIPVKVNRGFLKHLFLVLIGPDTHKFLTGILLVQASGLSSEIGVFELL